MPNGILKNQLNSMTLDIVGLGAGGMPLVADLTLVGIKLL